MENLIPVDVLCVQYQVNDQFFNSLVATGLIEIHLVREIAYVQEESLFEIEKIMRLHRELDVNLEGIDIVLNLLQKIDNLQNEMLALKNRLSLYEK